MGPASPARVHKRARHCTADRNGMFVSRENGACEREEAPIVKGAREEEAALAKVQSEQNAAAARLQLEQDCMKAESAARIAALTTSSAHSIDARRRPLDEEDDDIGETPLEAKSIIHHFSVSSERRYYPYFRNKFRPNNLFRLRHARGIRLDALQNKDRIGLDDGTLKLRRITGLYKHFGNTIYDVLD